MLDFYALSGLGLGPSESAEILSLTFITIIGRHYPLLFCYFGALVSAVGTSSSFFYLVVPNDSVGQSYQAYGILKVA